jgi:hypothetical protein
VGPVSSRRPDAAATSDDASATTRFQDGGIPRPVLALLVSSFGTLLGLALFAMLAIRLLDRRPLFDVSVARWRGRDDHLGRQGPA